MVEWSTHRDNKICIRSVEVVNLDYCRERFLSFEFLVQSTAKIVFSAQSLKHEDAHSDDALFRRISSIL